MKNFLLLILLSFGLFFNASAAEMKEVCIDVTGKDGKVVIDPKTKKPKQTCKKMKVHQKLEGTKVPDKK